MARAGSEIITSRSVLAVEGEDDRMFFDAMLRHLGVVGVQIESVGGKDQFKNKLPALLKTPGFFNADGSASVQHLAIVRDNDEDDAFASIANIVTKTGPTSPRCHGQFSGGKPQVGVFVMPGGDTAGTMLEDLCLESVKDHPAMECVRLFSDCVRGLSDPPRNPSKVKCQAFMAAQANIANSVGLAAKKGHWNLDSPSLGELRVFLEHLR